MRRGFPILIILVLIYQGCTDLHEPGVDLLTDANIKPKVINAYPQPGSEGPYYNTYDEWGNGYPIEIRFNKIMDRGSVINGFSLISSSNNKYIINDKHVRTYGGDIYFFEPFDSVTEQHYSHSNVKVGETFTFGMASNVKDVNGNFLASPFIMTFLPEKYFKIKKFYPLSGGVNVPIGYHFSISLNSPVSEAFFEYISINPILEGQWKYRPYYQDSTKIEYEYSNLPANQTYVITVREGAPDKYGNLLTKSYETKFSTTNISAIESSPHSVYASINSIISIYLSTSLDTSTVNEAFHITPNTEGEISIAGKSSRILFYPKPELLPNTSYTVTIDTVLKSANGYNLPNQYTFSFTTPGFCLRYRYPGAYGTIFNSNSTVNLIFTANLDTTTIRSAFHLDPQVTGKLDYNYNNSVIKFIPDVKFESFSTYTITIDSTLRSIGGLYLEQSYKFSFTTDY